MSSHLSISIIIRAFQSGLIATILWFLVSCATVGNPNGGPKDSTAPRLILDKTSDNLVTNETNRKWYFTFDEFVKINNPGKNIIVSPPLTHPLKVKIKGKAVTVELDDREVLKENTTYILNFSDAVQDITEGNTARGLQHVFSTGNTIDSLSISGRVIESFTGDTLKNLGVLLYEDLSDSAFFLQKPYYLSFTDSNGVFNFSYLRPDTFQLVVLNDENANLIYDGPPERIGFYSEPFQISSDTTINLPIVVFEEEVTPELEDYEFQSGLLTLNFEHSFYDTPTIEMIGLDVEDYQWIENTINLWYIGQPENNCSLILNDQETSDTTKLRYFQSKDKERSEKLKIRNSPKVNAQQNIKMISGTPMKSIDKDSISIIRDSLVFSPLEVQLEDPYTLIFTLDPYTSKFDGLLLLDNGAIQLYDNQKNDSLSIPVQGFQPKNTGNLFLEIEGLDSSLQYVVKLANPTSDWKQEWIIKERSIERDSFYYLQPGILEMTIIEDTDRNGRWSSGNYLNRIQPEKVFISELKGLKANWDLQTTVKTNF